ncbi:hypothetical protein ANRL4_03070 [Anaerolineae bacterium]|mgnify:FL=1|nr:hypothetical protein ANRL4_03070 [Anaerolineae bacterium]
MDALGSLRGVVNPTGEVLEGQHYTPYGTPFGQTDTAQTAFGFTGEITDPNGLLNLRARYYVPALGVFPSLDPVEEGNRYGYVGGDVVNRVDPSGMIYENDQSGCNTNPPSRPSLSQTYSSCTVGSTMPTPPSYLGNSGSSTPWKSSRPTLADYAFSQTAKLGTAFVKNRRGWINAARHLEHYLQNSGGDLNVDPQSIALVISDFDELVANPQKNAEFRQSVFDCSVQNYSNQPISLQLTSEWTVFVINPVDARYQDWYYALGNFSYAYTAVITIGTLPELVDVTYQVHIIDFYNWDIGKMVTIDIDGKGTIIKITDEQMARLHKVGLAQEYKITGQTNSKQIVNFWGVPTPAPTPVPQPTLPPPQR